MRYLVKPQNGIWVAVTDNFSNDNAVEELRKRTGAVQTWFFDLDDNHADSPAKKIAKRAIGTNHFSPRYVGWCAKTAWKLAQKGKVAESETWRDYVDSFLRGEEALEYVRRLFTPESARKSLYSGVEDFCGLVSGAERFYVTRNIAEVAEAYAGALGFNGFFPESDNKEGVVEEYVRRNSHVVRFGVGGDSDKDAAMIDVLRFYDKEVLGFYSMDKPNDEVHPKFDFYVSKDRSGLVELLGVHSKVY